MQAHFVVPDHGTARVHMRAADSAVIPSLDCSVYKTTALKDGVVVRFITPFVNGGGKECTADLDRLPAATPLVLETRKNGVVVRTDPIQVMAQKTLEKDISPMP
jgi:hypothetical protein